MGPMPFIWGRLILSLRVKSKMTLEDVVEGIEFAHARGKHVYLTLNLFSHNKDIDKLPDYIETVRKVKPDGLIVADPGVFNFVKQAAPELELHISTQANVCSWQSVKFWEDLGAKLCVLAREVSFEELREIRQKCPNIKAGNLYSWLHVHDLFRSLPAVQFPDRTRVPTRAHAPIAVVGNTRCI